MSRDHVDHSDISAFADEHVNLKRDTAAELRAQAARLGDKLDGYLEENPDFELQKMLLSGSLAKGTALKATSDADIACYVSSEAAPGRVEELIEWLATKLQKAFPNFKPEQIKRKTFSIGVTFVGTGNEVDIVPILYQGDPDWRGDLISQDTGEKLMTSVPMHLKFIRTRKKANERSFAQVVRLLKYWAAIQKRQNHEFRFKSFMVELILAHLADRGMELRDYPEALASFFNYIATDEFRSVIAFSDFNDLKDCPASSDPIRIWDPVNCANNVACLYTSRQKSLIVEAALEAGDAIDAALRAVTKGDTVRYWQIVFGSAFNA